MTAYTILSARFANAEHTAIEAVTKEVGAKLFGAADHPDIWSQIMAGRDAGRLAIEEYVAPLAPPPAISDRQFAHGLRKRGVITKEEALAFVRVGAVPAALEALIRQLPEDQRDDAEMLLAGSTTFNVDHPVVAAVAAAFGWSQEDLHGFWRFAGGL